MSTRSDTSGAARRVSDVTVPRSYDQWCPVAVGLDLLGDRWTMLILRELLMGDRRFTDLRHALPGLAPNLLTERLRTLTDIGLVTTAELPPPAARTVYRATDEGRATAPVLRSLARFGARHLIGEPGPAMDAHRAASALLLPWYRRVDDQPVVRVRLTVTSATLPAGDTVDLVLDHPVRIERRPTNEPAPAADVPLVTLVTTVEELAACRREERPLAQRPRGPKRLTAAVVAVLQI